MAKQRWINTKFWSDSWVVDLDPLERYLFLYFLTNEHTNISGVYELPLRVMAFETGLDKEMLEKMMPRFANKIFYIDGWVYIKNFAKHQASNESVEIGIREALKDVPIEIMAKIKDIDPACIHAATHSSHRPPYLNLNLHLNSNLDLKENTPSKIAKEFFSGGNKFQELFDIFAKQVPKENLTTEFKKFTLYWTEPNKSGTKQRWELQKTFDIKRRLYTWLTNASKFNKNYSFSSKGKEILGI